jgi:hypothetical protein
MKPLYKTTVVIWTEYDTAKVDPQLMDLRFHAEYEYVHVSRMKCVRVAEPQMDADWNDTEFWDEEADEDR